MSQCFRVGLLAMGSVLCAQCAAGTSTGNSSAPEGSSGGATSGLSGAGWFEWLERHRCGQFVGRIRFAELRRQRLRRWCQRLRRWRQRLWRRRQQLRRARRRRWRARGRRRRLVERRLQPGLRQHGVHPRSAPTSASASMAGPYQTMIYAANASVRMTLPYDVTSRAHHLSGRSDPAVHLASRSCPALPPPESSIGLGPVPRVVGHRDHDLRHVRIAHRRVRHTSLPPVREAALMDALAPCRARTRARGAPSPASST